MNWKEGAIVTGIVTGIQPYGIFVSLDERTQGLIHISEITDGYVKNIYDYVNVGESVRVKIIAIDEKTKRISLSLRDVDHDTTHIETPLGFQPLKIQLEKWIAEAKKKYNSPSDR
ncbi:general stress protein 13 [Anoxybacillus tengchongensis]|uniref:General stress protein 13 n=1 Tax=Anoxybacillus tengchongensis TaxID=576944 RepID=A0A7W9YSM0_9BACL|nr:CvfD/Ygs/GSP13 family RNA-binding post-transcriptional regulator [Anoxybacillus tengchongensis]MBB6177597.1 general stress protein 13 [Anoxybacillus tengchongensis]